MKSSIAVFTLWAALAAIDCQAWAPALTTSRGLTTTITNNRRRNYFSAPRIQPSTSIYATVEDEQQEKSSKVTPISSNAADTVSEAFNKDESSASSTFFSPIPYSELTIGIVKETFKGENRVSQTPDSVQGLVKAGFTVIVQSGGKIALSQVKSSRVFLVLIFEL